MKNNVCKIIYWHHNFAMALIKQTVQIVIPNGRTKTFHLRPSLLQNHASKTGYDFWGHLI